MTGHFLQIENLARRFPQPGSKEPTTVFEGVNFSIEKGEFVCIIGHSGCGKSTILNVLAGLDYPSDGHVIMDGKVIEGPSRDQGVIFQNHSLLPWLSTLHNVTFAVRARWPSWSRAKIREHSVRYLEMVGLGEVLSRKPAQLSGGMRQRVGIARAFAGNPRVVIADEPVSALDVSVQAAVSQLLMDIQRENRTTLVFISHDLSLVRYLADRVVVMYLGTIAEQGTTDEVFAPPYHPYTEALLSAVPIADTRIKKKEIVLQGDIPSAVNPPPGCPFQTRCPRKIGTICETEAPPIREFGPGHRIACHIEPAELEAMEPVITMPAKEAAA